MEDIDINDFEKFVLCDIETERVDVCVWVSINDGCLNFSGQDIGAAVEDFFGRDECEYFYDFDKANTEKLIDLLVTGEYGNNSNNINSNEFKKLLTERFNDMDGLSRIRKICDENNIIYEFYSWP